MDLQEMEKKGIKECECSECGDTYEIQNMRHYKYEPSRIVCDDCHDQLMEDDE